MDIDLKIPSFLEVLSDATGRFISEFLAIVIFPVLPRLEDSLSYSISVMNITFDFDFS